MRIDLYTKVVLTVIAVMLTFMACKSAVQPIGVAAEGALAAVQFTGGVGGFWAVDTRGGDVWVYEDHGNNLTPKYYGKITKLGAVPANSKLRAGKLPDSPSSFSAASSARRFFFGNIFRRRFFWCSSPPPGLPPAGL
jgi:hypothetical protein